MITLPSSAGSRGRSETLSSSTMRVSSASRRSISSRAIARISSSVSASRISRAPVSWRRVSSSRGTLDRPARAGPARGRVGATRRGRWRSPGATSSAWMASYRATTSCELVVELAGSGTLGLDRDRRWPATAGGEPSVVAPPGRRARSVLRVALGLEPRLRDLERLAFERRAAVRDRLAVGDERLLHRHDRDLDHVVGRLPGGDHLDPGSRAP